MRKTYLTGATGCLLVLLTACSTVTHQSGEAAPAGASPSVSAPASNTVNVPTSAPAVHGTPASRSTSSSGTPTKPAGSAALVPMQTSHGGEFQSPSGNITCEINYERPGLTQAYCQTGSPARSVTMNSNGSYKTCTGEQCLGNSGEGTPTLAYGKATGVGPFRCESATTGITCAANGKGFRIANSGVTSVTA
jgi:hypothetical protein